MFKDRNAWVVSLGLFGFQDYGIADRSGQYEQKLLLNTFYQGIEIPFLGEKETFSSGKNIPRGLLMRGTTGASLQNNSDNSSMSKPAELAKEKKKRGNSLLNPKYRAEHFSNDFYAPGDMRDATLRLRVCVQQFSAPTP